MRTILQTGFSLLEMLLAIGLFAMVLVAIINIYNRQSDDSKATLVALQMRTFGDAAEEYIKDNYATILQNTQANAMQVITPSDIEPYLNNNFSESNAYSQDLCVIVKRSPATSNNLIGLVMTEGGRTIDDITLAQISATIGSTGGAVYASNNLQVDGALGAWNLDVANFSGTTRNCRGEAGSVTIAAGHPAMALWFGDGVSRSAQGTLYRNPITGEPELNTMNTALIMGAAAIKVAGTACNTDPENPIGAIARDSNGGVLSCVSGKWANAGSSYWGDPISDPDDLDDLYCDAQQAGKVVMVKSVNTNAFNAHPYVPYACDGTGTWKEVAIDNDGNLKITGNLNVEGTSTFSGDATFTSTTMITGDVTLKSVKEIILKKTAVVGNTCEDSEKGSIALDANSRLLTCNGDNWIVGASANLKSFCYTDVWVGVGETGNVDPPQPLKEPNQQSFYTGNMIDGRFCNPDASACTCPSGTTPHYTGSSPGAAGGFDRVSMSHCYICF